MTTPQLKIANIAFPGAINLSNITSTSGVWSLFDGDNGADWCYMRGQLYPTQAPFFLQKFQGGSRAAFNSFIGSGAVPTTGNYQDSTQVIWRPSDTVPPDATVDTTPTSDVF